MRHIAFTLVMTAPALVSAAPRGEPVEFRNDGTYTFIGLMQTTVYNCTTSVFSQETGTYEMTGSEVSMHPQKNPYQMRYSCYPNSNKEAPGKLIERTYRYRVAGGKLELMGAGDSGPQTFQRSAD